MAVIPKTKTDPSPAIAETVNEIMRLYRSLPPRPSIEEVEAAMAVLKALNTEEETKLEEISNQEKPKDVSEELFFVLQETRKAVVLFRSHEHKKEALELVEVDRMFQSFDGFIQRASELVSGDVQRTKEIGLGDPVEKIGRESVISEESLVKKREGEGLEQKDLENLVRSSSTKAGFFYTGENVTERMTLMKVAALIENTAKTGTLVLDLQAKLTDNVEWIPVSIGKLSEITDLNLSDNRLIALPPTISTLGALTKLDLHSNQLINLPDTFGDLINLTDLDLHANKLKSLPDSFGNLTNLIALDLSSNHFAHLPDSVGNLTSLKTLNAETNELEEIPHVIGSCSSLLELRLDFNHLKALPEAIGKLELLEILTLHYNRIKGLPTTMCNLTNLKELDVSFNELESVPESLCFAVNLKKLNVGNNFADLRSLPRSIGNLELLEELDISGDQIRILPDSFRFLAKLRVFRADETPLEVPPRHVTKLGAQAVVEYMVELVAKREVAAFQPSNSKKKRGFWLWLCSICLPRCGTRKKVRGPPNHQV